MKSDPQRPEEFPHLLASLGEADVVRGEGRSEGSPSLPQSPAFVPWPDAPGDLGSGNIAQWLDRLGWVDTSDDEPAHLDAPQANAAEAPDPPAEEATLAEVLLELDRIAAELGEGTYRSATGIAAMRRIYAARHHPDRVSPQRRALATRQMMIANMMIDLALQNADAKRE